MESIVDAEARKNRKVKNQYVEAGFFRKLTFTWMFPLFYKGFKKGLTEDDLYPHLPSHDSEILGKKLERQWNKELNEKYPSLWKAFARVFGRELMFYGVGILLYELIRITLPLTLAKLLRFFEPNTEMTRNEAYLHAGTLCFTTLVQIMLGHHTWLHIHHMGMRLRVAVVALVYRKAIKLSKSALAETTAGQMVNLISNDVSRFENCTFNIHDVWVGPIQLFIILGLLYYNSGWTGITGIGLLMCFIPFQIWMGKKTSIYRLRTALKTDERIRLMNEIVSGIQVIKMYTWEKPFAKIVESVRRLEMKEIQNNSMIRAITMSFKVFLTRTLIYLSIAIYVLVGNKLNAEYLYVLSLYYELLRQCVSHSFAQGITQIAEAMISAQRIRKFLLYDEFEQTHNLPIVSLIPIKENDKELVTKQKSIGIHLDNVSAKWIPSKENYDLENIIFELSNGELAAVIGKVGSGKSTLLHVILKELPTLIGTAKIDGKISYASQEPWLFMGTVRQNILFGQEFDIVKYHEVVRVCALERDFKLFPYGDRTVIGERGASLSGGQRARINLARAVYKDADIYLLDDPLSAVDAHVGKQIFQECIEGYLKEKCVVLVTHQLQYLKNCKKIYLLNNGRVDQAGSYEDLENSGREFTKLLEEIKKLEEEAKKGADENEKKRRKTLSIKDNEANENIDDPTFEKEAKMDGKVTWYMYKSYFLAGGNAFKIGFLTFIFIFSQALASGIDYFLSVWVNLEQMKENNNVTNVQNASFNNKLVEQLFDYRTVTADNFLIIYSILIAIVVPMLIGRAIFFFRCCIQASTNLHNNMFSTIVNAPMRFFNMNPSGRILNRFSRDMNLVDEWLPVALSDTLQIGLMMSTIIVVVAAVTPIILIPTGVILLLFYLIRIVFIATSRDIKRFEAITRSPVYSHLTATLQGLTTIRAFKAQEMLTKEFDNYHDAYSSSYFMFIAANRTFGYWLDMPAVLFVTMVTFSFLVLKTEANSGTVGLAITQAIGLAGWCQFGIRQWSEMENTMTSIERIKEYATIPSEENSAKNEPPKNWPETGTVQFDKVSLRYAKDAPYVLRDLNFSIKSGEKVGIVGRTGAGKSSLITALFRLAENDGHILIDNVESKTIPLSRLRSSISIIPQEPVLFSGSLRKNLDPFDEYSDKVIWNALREVELKYAVSDLPQGLESKMSEGGSNFSVGQRQLVCLARAIIRNNKILVLDEATANVDPHTDGLIQTTIRRKFSDCTVLTIAHRLHTIMDSDKVLVMDAGRLVEFEHPHILLQNERGVLSSLVKQTGRAMAASLAEIAAKVYYRNRPTSEEIQ